MAGIAKNGSNKVQEVLSESYETSEKKTAKKKKNGVLEETSVTTTKTKKSKKSKKSDEKENHISVVTTPTRMEEDDLSNVCVRDLKSSFSKFDELSKKALASSMTDVPRTLQNGGGSTADISGGAGSPPPALCKSCGKNVFVMEQIKAEKQTWHKNCFRCKECNKQLTLDIYSSHEGILYCKPHFRELFKPKAVVESPDPEPIRRRKPEMIIRENQPLELPPDVVRASDKPDLGLEELSSLNVKSRYQVFEKSGEDKSGSENGALPPNVKRSPSILSKVAKFQAKGGLSAGVSDENLNGVHYEESDSSESSEAEQDDDVSREKIIKNRKKRERPLSFSKMSDVKKTWENGPMTKEERLEERKLEKQNLRSRLFMGKQGKMKEMYEQAVADSEKGIKREIDIQTGEKARNVREKFERGELGEDGEGGEGRNKSAIEEDLGVFEAGISKKSRSLFLELDANAAKTVTSTPPPHSASPRSPRFDESRRPSKEGESPDREVFRDPSIVRADEPQEDDSQVVVKSATASKMLSMFRQMEEAASKEVVPDGPKPLKRFTPPPDYKGHTGDTASEEEESSEEEEEEEEGERREKDGTGGSVQLHKHVHHHFYHFDSVLV
uniref:Xin actin-binding repeat-containing protein 2 n=1 Tax=Cacopsylla melanoneura TaxID=428564 RepID=A0A8D8SYD6_9HEMI